MIRKSSAYQCLPRLTGHLAPFQIVFNPDIFHDTVNVLTIVHSAIDNFEARKVIRETWGFQKSEFGINSKIVFVLGVRENASLQVLVEKEFLEHGDILQADFVDAYKNMSFKNLLGLAWMSQCCDTADIIVKTDDDYFIDIYEVTKVSDVLKANSGFDEGKLLACPVLDRSVVFRNPNDKVSGRWALSHEELPPQKIINWKRGRMEYYPPYCTGNDNHCKENAYTINIVKVVFTFLMPTQQLDFSIKAIMSPTSSLMMLGLQVEKTLEALVDFQKLFQEFLQIWPMFHIIH